MKDTKFYLYFTTIDQRKQGIMGFTNFMKAIMDIIIDLNGGKEEYKNNRLLKVHLIIDCNYNGKKAEVLFKDKISGKLIYCYNMDFDKFVEADFNLEYFGLVFNSIIRLVMLDYGIDIKRINEICKKVEVLKFKPELKYVKYDAFSP